MRISDWSSDVCSSDLDVACLVHAGGDEDGVVAAAQGGEAFGAADVAVEVEDDPAALQKVGTAAHHLLLQLEVGDAVDHQAADAVVAVRSEEHTSELQSLMRISYAVFCLKKKNINHPINISQTHSHTYTHKRDIMT